MTVQVPLRDPPRGSSTTSVASGVRHQGAGLDACDVRRYKKETLRILAEVILGSGTLAVIGGTVGVITAMCFLTGTEVGLQGYAALIQLGTVGLLGFVSAYFKTAEIVPLVAGIALAATVGWVFTAQLGGDADSEEVDALEAMAIPFLPFLVTTRIFGGLIAIIPLYVVGLLSSYYVTRLTVAQFLGQSEGTFDDYFNQFLPPGDEVWSFGKVPVFVVDLILIIGFHGYNASGGRRRRYRRRPRRVDRHRRESTSSTCSCRWPSGARRPSFGWRADRWASITRRWAWSSSACCSSGAG